MSSQNKLKNLTLMGQLVLEVNPTCKDYSSLMPHLKLQGKTICSGQCFIPSRSDYVQRLLEVETLDLADLHHQFDVPQLPSFVNSTNFDMQSIRELSPSLGDVVATKYWRIGGLLSKNFTKIENFRERAGLSKSQIVLVHAEGQDSKQERLWHHSRQEGFFQNLHFLSNAVYVAPNFSIYTDGSQCEIEQRYNLARSFRYCSLLNKAGLTTIPSISCADQFDRERIADWIRKQKSKITHMAVNCQMRGVSTQLNLEDMVQIEKLSERELHWVVFGPFSPTSFANFSSKFPRDRITFVSSGLVHKIKCHKDFYGKDILNRSEESHIRLIMEQINKELLVA